MAKKFTAKRAKKIVKKALKNGKNRAQVNRIRDSATSTRSDKGKKKPTWPW